MRLAITVAMLMVVAQATAPTPQRDQSSIDDVFLQLGRCNFNLSAEQRYTQKLLVEREKLLAQIKELEGKNNNKTEDKHK